MIFFPKKLSLKKHLPLTSTQIPESIKEALEESIHKKIQENYTKNLKKANEEKNLSFRFSKMIKRYHEDKLNECDILLINYLYGLEKIENLKFAVDGQIDFELKEPYLSLLQLRIQEHFFLKRFTSVDNKKLIIKNWQRNHEKETIFDLLYFINQYGNIENLKLTFPEDEYGFDEIKKIDDELFLYKGNKQLKKFQKPELVFLSNFIIDEKDERRLIVKGKKVPLIKELMRQDINSETGLYKGNKKGAIDKNGDFISPCTFCIHRVKQISNDGCNSCIPKII